MAHKIILVDDDRNILTSVKLALESEGFEVNAFSEGQKALDHMVGNDVDLVVLDIKMPRMDGMEVLGKIRETSSLPVIFLTSKDDEVDQVIGLRMGADDYITKPFSQRLLIERIRTLLRRQSFLEQDRSDDKPPAEMFKRGQLQLDDARHLCTWKGQALNLTVTEYLLIKALAAHPGHVKTRDQLIEQAYGENIYVDDRTVDSHIKRLRQKFKKSDETFNQIETLYGVGYRYKEEE